MRGGRSAGFFLTGGGGEKSPGVQLGEEREVGRRLNARAKLSCTLIKITLSENLSTRQEDFFGIFTEKLKTKRIRLH